jgi:hypothetical protein
VADIDPRRALLVSLLLLAPPMATAQDRPLQTESARTSPAGTVDLEIGGQAIRDEPNFLTGSPRTRWDAPELRVTFSPSANVELDVEWVGRVGAVDDPDYGSVSDFGDVTLRAKWRFADEPAVAARFGVTLPETSFGNGLGPNVLRMAAELLVTREWHRLALHANAGLGLHDEVLRPHEQRDFLVYGVAAVVPAGRAELVAEVEGRAGDGMPGADARQEARAGLRLWTGRLRWDAAVRRGLGDADGTWGLTAGVRLRLRSSD